MLFYLLGFFVYEACWLSFKAWRKKINNGTLLKVWRVSERKSWATGLQQRLLIWRNVFWATNNGNFWVSNTQSLPQRVQKMHFWNYRDHKMFCSSSFIPHCRNEEAHGEELCLHPAAALCSWMFGTAPNPRLQPSDILCDLFFFFPPASVYGWVKLPKHFGNNPAGRPEWLFVALSTAASPSPSIWWSLPGISDPVGWRGVLVCTHTLSSLGKLGWKLPNSTVLICSSKCLFMCFVIRPEWLQRGERKAACLHCSAFRRVWLKSPHFGLPKERRSTIPTNTKTGLGYSGGRKTRWLLKGMLRGFKETCQEWGMYRCVSSR